MNSYVIPLPCSVANIRKHKHMLAHILQLTVSLLQLLNRIGAGDRAVDVMSYSKLQSTGDISDHDSAPDNDASYFAKLSSAAAKTSEVEGTLTRLDENQMKAACSSKTSQITTSSADMGGLREVANGLKLPWGIDVAEDKTLAVAEWGGNSITLIGNSLRQSLSSTELVNPRAVAFTRDNHILASDSSNIYKLTREGRVVKTVAGSETLNFSSPAGIATHPYSGLIYVADTDNHRIQMLNPDLTRFGSFGKLGKKEGELSLPYDIAFDSKGNVLVADGNNRIQCFSQQGAFIDSFGEGRLDRPSSLTIDENGCIYVSELHKNRVSMFTKTGEYLHSIGCKEGMLNGPGGITCIGNELFIADGYNNRVVSLHIDVMA